MTETEALIERYYEAFNAGDREAMLACLADDVRHDVNEGEARGGKDKFRAFMEHMDTCYSEQLTDMAIMVSRNGRRAAAEFIVNGIYRTTDGDLPPAHGQRYRLPAGAFFEVEDGFIRRVTTYYNLNEWIRQVS